MKNCFLFILLPLLTSLICLYADTTPKNDKVIDTPKLIKKNIYFSLDSIVFCNGIIKTDTIEDILLRYYNFSNKELFNSNQVIFVVDIPASSQYNLQYAHEPVRTQSSVIAKKHNATIAVNGSFFDMAKHFPICYLRIDSANIGENTPGKDPLKRKYYQYGTLCFNSDSVVILRTDSLRCWEDQLPYPNIMTAGPLLIYQDELQQMRTDRTFVTDRHNRTSIGIRPDKSIVLLVADGRFKEAEGLTLFELQKLMKWLGCKDALNLDGGGSTTLFVNYNNQSEIINFPSDNNRFDHAGERKVSNAILITKKATR